MSRPVVKWVGLTFADIRCRMPCSCLSGEDAETDQREGRSGENRLLEVAGQVNHDGAPFSAESVIG